MQPHFTRGYEQRGRSGDVESVCVDGDGLDQLLDQHSPLLVVGVLPDVLELERRITQQGGGSLERFDAGVRGALGLDRFSPVGFKGGDLCAE